VVEGPAGGMEGVNAGALWAFGRGGHLLWPGRGGVLDGGLCVVRVVMVIDRVRLAFPVVMHGTVDRKAVGGVVGGI